MRARSVLSLLGVYALCFVVAVLLVGCAVTRESAPPDLVPEWERLEQAEQAAALTPDRADDAAVEAQFAELEARVLQRNASPFASLLPGVGPVLVGLVPLLGKRGRKHYGNAIKRLSRGQVMVAAGDVLKAMGAQHSSPESEAASQPPQPLSSS